MPSEFKERIILINKDLDMVASFYDKYMKSIILQGRMKDRTKLPEEGMDTKFIIAELMNYEDFEAEIELNLKEVLENKNFSIKNFKWKRNLTDKAIYEVKLVPIISVSFLR